MLCESMCHQINNECWFTRSKRTREIIQSHWVTLTRETIRGFLVLPSATASFFFFPAARISLNFSPGASSMLVPLLRNYRHQPQSLFQTELQKAMSGPCDICWAMWSGRRGDGLDTRLVSVCVNLIMLTDYRFKYFKSHRAHAAGDVESENDCSNARD